MKKLKIENWLLISLGVIFCPMQLFAQGVKQQVEMADQFRADGKIYIVVVIMVTIILGLSLFAFRMDRKLTKLEKRMGEKE